MIKTCLLVVTEWQMGKLSQRHNHPGHVTVQEEGRVCRRSAPMRTLCRDLMRWEACGTTSLNGLATFTEYKCNRATFDFVNASATLQGFQGVYSVNHISRRAVVPLLKIHESLFYAVVSSRLFSLP